MAAMNLMALRHHSEDTPEGLVHRVDLEGLPSWMPGPRALYWKLRGLHDLPSVPVLDHFVIGLVLPLAAAGGEVRVHGAMSRSGLFNVQRLLELRRATSPGRYGDLRIVPDSLIDGPRLDPGDRRAVIAFSGGLDSTHAALRQSSIERADSLDLRALVMVHGFDAPTERPDMFARMLDRATPLAARIGIPLLSVETNSKYLYSAIWPQTSTPLAAAALALFRHMAAYGIFGGGLPYSANFLPLGHQPLFDQHCSGAGFTLITDSAGLSRKQKIVNMSADPSALTGLRVCWAGRDVSRNCGECERCLATKLNLRMAGLDEGLAFDTPLDVARLRAIAPKSLYTARDLAEYTWRDVRDDPALTDAARVLRETLAAVPPVSVAASLPDVLRDILLPASARRGLAELGKRLKRLKGLPRRLRARARRKTGRTAIR